jgi:hypothetical protein
MKNHPFLNTLSAVLGSISFLILAELKAPSYTFADDYPLCSPTYDLNAANGFCEFPAETYGTTFYQIAICKSNPLVNPTPDTSSCFFLFNNSAGQYVDVAQFIDSAITMNTIDSMSRPPNGDYPYAYGVLSNSADIKGSVTVQSGTFHTTNQLNPNHHYGSLASTNSASKSIFNSVIWSEMNEQGIQGCFESGEISYLNSNGQPTTYNDPYCTGAAKTALSGKTEELLGSMLTITDDVRGLEMKFGATRALHIFKSSGNVIIDFQGFSFTLELLR